jgi:hypothetical protein
MAKSHGITAGVFSMPDFYLFSTFVNKPWNKFHVYSLGMLSAILFIDIKSYRRCVANRDTLSKSQNMDLEGVCGEFPVIDYLYRKKYSDKAGCI